jgi:hypothetical protein
VNEILNILGLVNPSGRWALFWGGIAGDLPEFAIIALIWRKVNCHAKGCYRVGLHHVDGTHFVTCKKHHPVHPGNKSATADEIAAAHAKAHAAAAAHDTEHLHDSAPPLA